MIPRGTCYFCKWNSLTLIDHPNKLLSTFMSLWSITCILLSSFSYRIHCEYVQNSLHCILFSLIQLWHYCWLSLEFIINTQTIPKKKIPIMSLECKFLISIYCIRWRSHQKNRYETDTYDLFFTKNSAKNFQVNFIFSVSFFIYQ